MVMGAFGVAYQGNRLNYTAGFHVNNGNWHYLAVTMQQGKITLYLDGMLAGSCNITTFKPTP